MGVPCMLAHFVCLYFDFFLFLTFLRFSLSYFVSLDSFWGFSVCMCLCLCLAAFRMSSMLTVLSHHHHHHHHRVFFSHWHRRITCEAICMLYLLTQFSNVHTCAISVPYHMKRKSDKAKRNKHKEVKRSVQ